MTTDSGNSSEGRYGFLSSGGARALSAVVFCLSAATVALVAGDAARSVYLPICGAMAVLSLISGADAAVALRAIRRQQRSLDAEIRASVEALVRARRLVREAEIKAGRRPPDGPGAP